MEKFYAASFFITEKGYTESIRPLPKRLAQYIKVYVQVMKVSIIPTSNNPTRKGKNIRSMYKISVFKKVATNSRSQTMQLRVQMISKKLYHRDLRERPTDEPPS